MTYIRYILKNVEPLRITDDSTSQYGQIDTLTYIPGMTIRGVVIQTLAEQLGQETEKWEQIRQELFSNQVSFLNAYPIGKKGEFEEVELIPSPRGFCENKESLEEEKEITNVLKGEKTKDGLKKAGLGRYCYIDKKTIFFSSVELSGDMRISIKNTMQKKEMFRSQYMVQNQKFCGYIAVQNPELCKRISSIFEQNYLLIGNGRSTGMGKCEILEKSEVAELSYQQYIIQDERKGDCYLYLLSHMLMRNKNGELTGMDIPTLEKQLGVEQLEIERCATSTVKNNGYNRLWNTKLPEMVMYEMGSVFRLRYHGVLKKEKAAELLDKGIGIRKNEGFGRVLILEGYEQLEKKRKIEKSKNNFQKEEQKTKKKQIDTRVENLTKEEKQILLIAAKGYYVEKLEQAGKNYLVSPKNHKNPILGKKLTGSQMGTIASYAATLQFMPKQAEKELLDYLEHAVAKDEAKRIQTKAQKRNEVKEFIETFFRSDLDSFLESEWKEKERIMGIKKEECFTEEESLRWKLRFLIEMIRFANREGIDDGESTV